MKKRIYVIFIMTLYLVFFLTCKNKKKGRYETYSENKLPVLKQLKRGRQFYNGLIELINEISFEKLNPKIFIPTEVKIDSDYNIYIFDFPERKIHKLSPKKIFTEFNHTVFRNQSLLGRGPGEITRLLDIKFHKSCIYLLDEGSNSLIIYSNDGSFADQIKINSNQSIPYRKLTFSQNMPLLCSYGSKNLFYQINYKGEIIKSFGRFIDQNNMNNVLYHQYSVSKPINQTDFYYFPLYLGYVGYYTDTKLKFVKETIDGRQYPEVLKERRTDGSVVTKMKGIVFRTVYKNALTSKFILIRASDMRNKLDYWDIYQLENFNYLFSIKYPPESNAFDIYGDFLVSVDENGVKIFSIKALLKRVELVLKK